MLNNFVYELLFVIHRIFWVSLKICIILCPSSLVINSLSELITTIISLWLKVCKHYNPFFLKINSFKKLFFTNFELEQRNAYRRADYCGNDCFRNSSAGYGCGNGVDKCFVSDILCGGITFAKEKINSAHNEHSVCHWTAKAADSAGKGFVKLCFGK